MHQDRQLKGKMYRLFWEEKNIYHPEGAPGHIYCITDRRKIGEDYTALPGETAEDVSRELERILQQLDASGCI